MWVFVWVCETERGGRGGGGEGVFKRITRTTLCTVAIKQDKGNEKPLGGPALNSCPLFLMNAEV